jgi:hypothetical protein
MVQFSGFWSGLRYSAESQSRYSAESQYSPTPPITTDITVQPFQRGCVGSDVGVNLVCVALWLRRPDHHNINRCRRVSRLLQRIDVALIDVKSSKAAGATDGFALAHDVLPRTFVGLSGPAAWRSSK